MILILLISWRLSYYFLRAEIISEYSLANIIEKMMGIMRIQHTKNLAQQHSWDPFSLPTSKDPVWLAVPLLTSVIVKSCLNHFFPEGLFYCMSLNKCTTFHCTVKEINETWIFFTLICCLTENNLPRKNTVYECYLISFDWLMDLFKESFKRYTFLFAKVPNVHRTRRRSVRLWRPGSFCEISHLLLAPIRWRWGNFQDFHQGGPRQGPGGHEEANRVSLQENCQIRLRRDCLQKQGWLSLHLRSWQGDLPGAEARHRVLKSLPNAAQRQPSHLWHGSGLANISILFMLVFLW